MDSDGGRRQGGPAWENIALDEINTFYGELIALLNDRNCLNEGESIGL